MRLAIIGCGSIGTRHLKNALALGCEVEVLEKDVDRANYIRANFPSAYVCDTSSDGLGITYRRSSVGLDYDAAMVCTPYDTHQMWARWVVGHSMPVFVEKPLGSLDQIEDWRALVKASEGLTTQVGYQFRFHPKARAMKLLFPDAPKGRFGCHCDMSTWPGKSYGPLLLEASHEIDLALWFGAPATVKSVEHTRHTGQRIRFDDHWDAWLSDSPGSYSRTWIVEDYDDHGVEVYFGSHEELGDQMYIDELKHFLDCVQSGKQTDCPLSDGLRVLEVCKQVEEMARQHV